MTVSSALSQRLAMVLVLAAPLGLVHCGDDDGGGSTPAATGGTGTGGATGGAAPTGGKSTGGASGGTPGVTGGTGTGGTPDTGGTAGTGGAGGSTAGGGGDAGSAGSAAAGDTGEGGGGASGGSDGEGGAGGGETGEQPLHSLLIGTFAPFPDYDVEDIVGQALLSRSVEGETRLSLQVLGLQEETEYPAFVHNLPCEFEAGTRYKFDPTGDDDDEENEIWATFETDADGIGNIEVSVAHLARGDAMSVVVLDPDADETPVMACADLTLDSDAPLTATGNFAPFAAAEDEDDEITGAVEFVRTEDGTELSFEITGLGDEAEYMSHVHALPCDVNDAGGHYKIDPTEPSTIEENELWLDLGSTADGEAADSFSTEHRSRLDAQSVVLHRAIDDDNVLKVACAPLEIEEYPALLADGTGTPFVAAAERGLDDIQALGSLRRALDGTTRVRVSAIGLGAEIEYPVHVHSLPCGFDDGGPHYKIDIEEADTIEENELWVTLATDADGAGSGQATFEHTARADARALVIHDPEDSTRLVCIDLL